MVGKKTQSLFDYYGFSELEEKEYPIISGILRGLTPNKIKEIVQKIEKSQLPANVKKWHREYERIGPRSDFICKWTFQGMQRVTLSSVADQYKEPIYATKTKSIILNYLVDDIADKTKQKNLLKIISSLGQGNTAGGKKGGKSVDLSRKLWQHILKDIKQYPRYLEFKDLFMYDYCQFFNALEYSFLMNNNYYLSNFTESQIYLSHNMQGMISVDIDLMASPKFDIRELATLREIVWRAQRMGRIGNSLTTWQREIYENDFTSDIFALAIKKGVIEASDLCSKKDMIIKRIQKSNVSKEILKEWEENYLEMQALSRNVKSINAKIFIKSLEELMIMHLISVGYK